MAAQLGLAVPASGLVVALTAVALWLSPLSPRWLDAIVAALLACGLALGLAGWARGADVRVRRLSILALGCSALGLLALGLVYAAG